MKQKLWITLATYLAYCIDKELYQVIDYLREQVRVLVEHQEKQDKRIRLSLSSAFILDSRFKLRFRALPENRAARMVALIISVTAALTISIFVAIICT